MIYVFSSMCVCVCVCVCVFMYVCVIVKVVEDIQAADDELREMLRFEQLQSKKDLANSAGTYCCAFKRVKGLSNIFTLKFIYAQLS